MEGNTFNINYAKNFSRNIATNILQLVVSIAVGLLLIPFFLDTLGPSSYALIPLATSLTSYVTLIIDALNSTVSRYMTIELQRGDYRKANETYNTAYILLLGFIIICIPVVLLVSYFVPSIFDIGSLSQLEVQIFFALILGSILTSTLKSNQMAILFSYNRLDLRNIVNIAQTSIQILLIIIFFALFGPTLIAVGTSYMAAAIVSCILAYLFAKKQTSQLVFSVSAFNKSRIKELSFLSAYLLFDRLGCLFQSQIALIVVNIYFGATMQAEYSLIITWVSLIISIGSVFTSTASPMVYSLTAKNDNKGTINFVSMFTKGIGVFIALPIALLCIYAPQLLTLWVGAEYVHVAPLVWLLLPVCFFTITLSPQVAIAISHNRMQFPAVLNMVVGVVYLIFALLLPVLLNNGYYGVAIAYGVIMCIHHGVISPIYYARVIHAPSLTFMKWQWFGFAILAILLAVGYLMSIMLNMYSPLIFIVSAILFSAVYFIIVVKVLLNKEDKAAVKLCLPNAVRKLKIIERM